MGKDLREANLVRQRLAGYKETSRITRSEDAGLLRSLSSEDGFRIFLDLYALGAGREPDPRLARHEIGEIVETAARLACIRLAENGEK